SNSAGASAASNVATATTASTVPAAPSNLALTVQSANSIALAWADNSSNETGFRVERQTAGGSWSLLATTGAGVSSYTDTTVSANTQYSYRVSATNGAGTSAASNVATGTTPPPVSLNVWENHAMASQTGMFTATFDAVPTGTGLSILGLSGA